MPKINTRKNLVSPESSNNSKKFWSYIKSRMNNATVVAPLKDEHGVQIAIVKQTSSIVQFSSVFNKKRKTSTPFQIKVQVLILI